MSSIPENSAELTFNHLIISIIRLWKYLLSKWLIICIVGFSGGILGIIYGWLEEPKYEAALTFSTEEDKSSSVAGLAGIAAQFGFSVGSVGGVFSGDNVLALIRSQKMISQTLLTPIDSNGKKQSLLNIYLDATHMSEGFKKNELLKNLSFPLNQDSKTFSRLQDSILLLVIDRISKTQLKVDRPDVKVAIYRIDCITTSEFFSKEFVTHLIKNVSDFYIATKTQRSLNTVAIIQNRADSIKRAFDAAIEGRASLSDANINPAFQQPQVGIQKKQSDISLLGAAYGEILKNLELAKFNLLRDTPYIQIIDEPVMPLRKIKTGRLVGGLLGGVIAGFVCVLFLLAKRAVKNAKAKYTV